MNLWKEEDLKGLYTISVKLDGVKAINTPTGWVSRANKPLYNLPKLPLKEVEVFYKDWNTTISLVRTQKGTPVSSDYLYSLDPLDKRLVIEEVENPTVDIIKKHFKSAVEKGYEGLVLHGSKVYKVKTKETYDVPITEIQLGKGKFQDLVGAFFTTMGKVGTGMTKEQRKEYLSLPIGTIIEVDCMEVTKNNKFRHPRFIRVREDK